MKRMRACSRVNDTQTESRRGRNRANIFCRLFEYFICPFWRLIVLRSHCVYSRVQTELESSLAFLLLSLFDSCVFACVCVSLCVRESEKKNTGEKRGKDLVFYLMASHISRPIFTQFLAWSGSDSGRPDTQ